MRPEDILIVNDGSPFLKPIGLLLADKGYGTCVTDTPSEALAELARKYFRLVIVKLPGETTDSPALLKAVQDLNPKARLIILGVFSVDYYYHRCWPFPWLNAREGRNPGNQGVVPR